MADSNMIPDSELFNMTQILTSKDIREEIEINPDDGSLELKTFVSPLYSYALCVNETHLVKKISIKNNTEKDIYDLKVKITTDNDLIEPCIIDIPIINAGMPIIIKRPELLAHASMMLSLSEATICYLRVAIIYQGKEVVVNNDKVELLLSACQISFTAFCIGA